MVLPIVIGVGITAAALTTKALLRTVARYRQLTPQMFATLNRIRLEDPSSTYLAQDVNPSSHIRYLKATFDAKGFERNMTEREALLIMGINADDIASLTKDTLRKRYRKLMVMNHPDRHGSVYLSQKINQAKEVLEKSYLFRR
ncbi:putative mitochondrial DnaJ protein [Clavispora lusitaniae]|uniref:J domain-containing protein n=3 Tax=Clavispora lusitaniae TaxID=36911 RepID=C4XW27_CLAL4|nr:uncharacterized protein CLUG_00150 [Clavispora lusitaniae ATCC 42720]KAF5213426.1 hypothetical protein E0198_000947 [Clavispora lusitaniae]EEQ36027.1 hypothetical protein CLUG_00150 [Clavispora lusitaniae ATCC 42720]KAF7584084.1 DnaJ domain family protein [Clavispora lusitaniae]OVF06584.1 putative mitochondrial DnaJ [Clavispora lusitaniae]QFZ25082.1 putative mitochondrial DnaJ protein [Clavispora lusitaniae]